jgi:outer membrane protein
MPFIRAGRGMMFVACLALMPGVAAAQQPLSEFLEAAEDGNLDLRAARAALAQSRSQVDEARARLLPSASATGTYTRNEYEVVVQLPNPGGEPRQAVISPYDQLEGRFTIAVPILDLSAWASFLSAEASADAVDGRTDNVEREARGAVVVLWHQLVGSRMVASAAERSLSVAEQSRANAAARVEVGAAPQLELDRAEAEVQRARQSLVEAQLGATLAARNLQNASGLAPSDRIVQLDDDLAPEPALERYLGALEQHPSIRAARSDALAAERGEHAAWLSLAPTISGQLTERVTNAAGFGPTNQWAAGVTATWQLDFGRPAAIGTRGAAAERARIGLEQAQQQVETQIFEAWQRVASARARAEASQAALAATRRASQDAQARFETGAATQLDVIQTERDLFTAEVGTIQAIADLRVARALLRIRSGVGEVR